MRKRERFDILLDMLEFLAEGPRVQTKVMYRANLNHKQLQEYVEYLQQNDLATVDKKTRGTKIHITELGFKYLNRLREVREFERAFSL